MSSACRFAASTKFTAASQGLGRALAAAMVSARPSSDKIQKHLTGPGRRPSWSRYALSRSARSSAYVTLLFYRAKALLQPPGRWQLVSPWSDNEREFFLSWIRNLSLGRAQLTKPIHDPSHVDIVWGHFQVHPIANGEPNKTFSHFARNMSEHDVIVRKANSEHGARENGGNQS